MTLSSYARGPPTSALRHLALAPPRPAPRACALAFPAGRARPCVKMAASLRHTLLRLYPTLLRGYCGVQVNSSASPRCLCSRPSLRREASKGPRVFPCVHVLALHHPLSPTGRFFNNSLRVLVFPQGPPSKRTRLWGYPSRHAQLILRWVVRT